MDLLDNNDVRRAVTAGTEALEVFRRHGIHMHREQDRVLRLARDMEYAAAGYVTNPRALVQDFLAAEEAEASRPSGPGSASTPA